MSTEIFASNQLLVSRKEALATGQTWYFTGDPCKYGHIARRMVTSRGCMPCVCRNSRNYANKHPEKIQASGKEYRMANKEACAARDKAWRQSNPDKIQFYRNDWGRKNPEKIKIMNLTQHHHRRVAEGKFTAADIRDINASQKGKCAYCKVLVKKTYHVDHIIPIKLGGTNNRSNLQLLCQPCNQRKGAKHPIVFAQSLGLLL